MFHVGLEEEAGHTDSVLNTHLQPPSNTADLITELPPGNQNKTVKINRGLPESVDVPRSTPSC